MEPSFIAFISNAQQRLTKLYRRKTSASRVTDQTNSESEARKVFQKEWYESYAYLNEEDQTKLRELLESDDFRAGFNRDENKVKYVFNQFDRIFRDFSPLHPAYPMLNILDDGIRSLGETEFGKAHYFFELMKR